MTRVPAFGRHRLLERLAPPEAALVALTIPGYWLWAFATSWLTNAHGRQLLGYLIWVALGGN